MIQKELLILLTKPVLRCQDTVCIGCQRCSWKRDIVVPIKRSSKFYGRLKSKNTDCGSTLPLSPLNAQDNGSRKCVTSPLVPIIKPIDDTNSPTGFGGNSGSELY